MFEHPVQQEIRGIDIDNIPHVQGGYTVGRNEVTRIEACTKPGLHCDIPYVRVWKGDVCEAEFCQHNIVGVYFADVEGSSPPAQPSAPDPAHTGQPSCTCFDCIPF